MSAQVSVADCSAETVLICNPPDPPQPIAHIPTGVELDAFHLSRVKFDKKGNERPQQSLDNERSVIASWRLHLKLDPQAPVGEELGARFPESLAKYEKALRDEGLAPSTISDRRCILRKYRESFLEFQRTAGLPPDFHLALRCLMDQAGISVGTLSIKSGVNERTLHAWLSGKCIPVRNSLPLIRKLEKFFRVPEGTLSSRLPDVLWTPAPDSSQTTPWRAHQSVLTKLTYRLPSFPDRLEGEWQQVVRFFTDEQWVDDHGLKRNSEWRIRWNTGLCPTAEIKYVSLRSYFGYLHLPTANEDPRIVGLGFSLEELTLALITDADLVIKYLHFMKARSVSNSFNNQTLQFLIFCLMLLRKKTGYLRQLPEFGALLPEPVDPKDWAPWCDSNFKKLRKFRKKITGKKKKGRKSKKGKVKMTRNPFEPVIDIIREREHPVTAIFDVAKKMESLTPLLERGSKVRLAVHHQEIFQVRLSGSNPLRVENFAMMRFVPKDYGAFKRACEIYRRRRETKQPIDYKELYVEAATDSNLYQKPDGSFQLRYNERDFKNDKGEDLEEGVLSMPYDVPVLRSVWPALAEYLFGGHHEVLNESIRDALVRVRAERGLSPLSAEEELAILRCPYVFRPTPYGILKLGPKRLEGYGTAQISSEVLSARILRLTRRYLRRCGFSAHACRHLVATDYIKNHPDGFAAAAAALHNTEATVRKHYAWVEAGDLMRPWNNYHEHLQEMYERGEI